MAYVLPALTLFAPGGGVFVTDFIENDVKVAFRVQLMNYGGVDGVDAATHGADGRRWRFTHYFAGATYLEEARRFEKALTKPNGDDTPAPLAGLNLAGLNALAARITNGRWTMIHPTEGRIANLVPVSYSRTIAPVRSGNVAEAEVEWVEALPDTVLAAAPTLWDSLSSLRGIGGILGALQTVNAAFNVAAEAVRTCVGVVAAFAAVASTAVKSALDAMDNLLASFGSIAALGAGVGDAITALYSQISADAFNEGVVNLVDLFTRVGNANISAAKETARNAGAAMDADAANQVAVRQAFAMAAAIAIATAIASALFKTREEALAVLDAFIAYLAAMRDAFESVEAVANGLFVDETSADNTLLAQAVAAHVLQAIWEAPVTRRFVIDKDTPALRASIIVNASSAQTADADFDRFIEINGLHGYDVLILRAGTTIRSTR
jgi:hypothetical protein